MVNDLKALVTRLGDEIVASGRMTRAELNARHEAHCRRLPPADPNCLIDMYGGAWSRYERLGDRFGGLSDESLERVARGDGLISGFYNGLKREEVNNYS